MRIITYNRAAQVVYGVPSPLRLVVPVEHLGFDCAEVTRSSKNKNKNKNKT